jgi:hypothetical protein
MGFSAGVRVVLDQRGHKNDKRCLYFVRSTFLWLWFANENLLCDFMLLVLSLYMIEVGKMISSSVANENDMP